LAREDFEQQLRRLPVEERKLLCVIVQQGCHGSLRTKEPGIATMPEVHEVCGLDVDGMYAALRVLRDAGVIKVTGQYPFEEIGLTGTEEQAICDYCHAHQIALEDVFVDLRFDLLKA
jgi:hypothetical protein